MALGVLRSMYEETGEPVKAVDLRSRIAEAYSVDDRTASTAVARLRGSDDIEYNLGSYTPR